MASCYVDKLVTWVITEVRAEESCLPSVMHCSPPATEGSTQGREWGAGGLEPEKERL